MRPSGMPVYSGDQQFGMVHTFTAAGDALPPHAHDETTLHTSTIAAGRFRVISERCGGEYGVGAHFKWRVDEMHGFEALEPGSVLVQIVKEPSC